ncbi:carbon-nitrogen hydrolase family protein [Pontixanthobacter luteolus]|uniref:carbon-nitrogen hydrolase family protein n=1 Tax=Pontixanthobacter luteolus TaxID=295089 RepID=UPI00230238EC|nr:carbon-nitrogen hydrolase family protein [Pontixanthobacter luteolus]
MHRISILQMTSGIDPEENGSAIVAAVKATAEGGGKMLFTPEMCGLLDRNRKRAAKHIVSEGQNGVLTSVCQACAEHGVWASLGSLPVLAEGGRFANRAFVIDADGEIRGRYDKIHMFDVDLETGESWRESNAYQPGNAVSTVYTPLGKLGLTICYDIRFPALFQELGGQRCDLIAIPAAFTVPTGRDHWHILQRARAIEASAFVVAAAQVGQHEDGRDTYGHSLVVDPWGKVILDMEQREGLEFAELDLSRIEEVRRQLPSLANRRDIPRSDAP